jgi:TetR/AcrR family transcriptional repressor of nem operon
MSRRQNTEARERILESAQDLIYRYGFKGVSMEDIAEAAQIKKPNLFHYYPTKERLGLAVFDYATRGFHERWAARLDRAADPMKTIGDLFDRTMEGMEECGCCGGCFIGNLAQELSDHSEALRERLSNHFESWHKQLANFLEEHKASGYFQSTFDPDAAAQAVLASFEGALLIAKATRRAAALANARVMAVGFLDASRRQI